MQKQQMNEAVVFIIGGAGKFYRELEQHQKIDNMVVNRADYFPNESNIFESYEPHIVILNCSTEGVSGLAYCQQIRTFYSGLLLLISEQKDNNLHKLALDLGADSSMTCSDGVPLIAALIRALLRRFVTTKPERQLTFGNVTIDAERRDAFITGKPLTLSSIEFQLFWCLAQKAGRVVSRDELHKDMYKTTYNGYDRSIDLYVSRIRQKLGNYPISAIHLKTVRGIGYQFIDDTNCYNNEILEP
jgi:DNA-binding response OmpR family regulator